MNKASDELTKKNASLSFSEAMDLVVAQYEDELRGLPYGSPESAQWSENDFAQGRICIDWIEAALAAKTLYNDAAMQFHDESLIVYQLREKDDAPYWYDIALALELHMYGLLAL